MLKHAIDLKLRPLKQGFCVAKIKYFICLHFIIKEEFQAYLIEIQLVSTHSQIAYFSIIKVASGIFKRFFKII